MERVEYVKDRLTRKHRKWVKAMEWDPLELEELGPILKSQVQEAMQKRKWYAEEIDYYTGAEIVMDRVFTLFDLSEDEFEQDAG